MVNKEYDCSMFSLITDYRKSILSPTFWLKVLKTFCTDDKLFITDMSTGHATGHIPVSIGEVTKAEHDTELRFKSPFTGGVTTIPHGYHGNHGSHGSHGYCG